MTNDIANILEVAEALPANVMHRSGSVFYSGRAAFSTPSRVYVLGLNPGGSPKAQAGNTVQKDLSAWSEMPPRFSRYLDEQWEGKSPGRHGMQPRMQHLFNEIGVDARATPASNVVFVRSASESDLASEKSDLLAACWPVHEAVLGATGADTVICLGGTAGRWVRERLSVNQKIDSYSETNDRGWTSEAHENGNGMAVVTLTHPGRANWCNPKADPSELVRRVLAR